ncbi:MAG: acyl-CoA synthetase FdrA [Anaerolineae bacterium]|nr:acyl-CoA synthetase FdrA [Anaerolineae bacterium]
MSIRYVIKASQYFDSVALMNIARDVRALPGIEDAALVMGTEANKGLLEQLSSLSAEAQAASPTDLIMMVVGDESALDDALATAETLLTQRPAAASGDTHRPRTLRSAARTHSDANLVVISVAGTYATAEAWTALRQGLHVLLFSDNVSLDDEIVLKQYAVAHGLLLMGPGAGTAIINGAALGFANVVPPGPVGIISAAGTGLQEVSTLLARQGVGITQGIGVGGRDLSDAVGGLMMLHAAEALHADPATEVLVAISKLPSPAISAMMLDSLAASNKPAVVIFMGADELPPAPAPHVYLTRTLQEAALTAAALVRGEGVTAIQTQLTAQQHTLRVQADELAAKLTPGQKYLRGLFSGGTLCEEAMRLWSAQVSDVWSNGPLKPEFKLPDSNQSQGHCALDLGEEEFTVGRPHPMIDNDLRIRRLLQEAADPEVAVIQLDLVLGYGAHLDPASELAPAIREARAIAARDSRYLLVIGALTGTEDDPQNLSRQAQAFADAGTILLDSNADASHLAACIVNSTV